MSKYEAEQGLNALIERTSMEVVIVRPTLVYGPAAPGNVARLTRMVGSGWPLPFANICAQRSLLSLENLADFLRICLEHPAAAGETFLIADDDVLSLPGLIRNIAVEMGRKPRLFPFPQSVLGFFCKIIGRESDYQRLVATLRVDTGKAKRLCDWSPPLTTAEGLGRMLRNEKG